MGMPNSQLQILAAIENELQEDPSLAAAFSAFTSATQDADIPAAEQLGTPDSLPGWRTSRSMGLPTFLGQPLVALVAFAAFAAAAVLIALAALFAAAPGGGRHRCEPVDPAFRTGREATCVPLGPRGRFRLTHLSPLKGHA
jgi:hypothetical protein